MVDFFIERPVLATVVALLVTLAGALCIPRLPVAQYPDLTPPTVQVSASYPGASAEVVEQAVTIPLEQQINGVKGMLYMSSNSSNDGSTSIIVTFELGYDLDIAAVDVQNRVAVAQAQLPEEVQRLGVTVRKQSTDLTVVVNLISPDGSRDDLFLSNYADLNIADRIKRLPGVGDVHQFGSRLYSMRVWLDPDKLAKLGIGAPDVVAAIRDQNQQIAAGALGQPPAPPGQQFEYTLVARGRLRTPEEFANVVLRTRADGSLLRLRDVGHVELGAESYGGFSRLGRDPSTGLGIYLLPGGNALQVADSVRAEMERLSQRFPPGVAYRILYDPTAFVRESIREVLRTLVEALVLVVVVVYVFLQTFRAMLIPAITVPVSLVGAFAVMWLLGFSINTLTLFGLVLAIGLVVDDAIVVVENTRRILDERPELSPQEATKTAMREVTGPIVAISLVLMAVFVPVAFLPGTTGRLYQQFALTIAASVGISAVNALTLSPALCARFLRGRRAAHVPRPLELFDRGLTRFRDFFERSGRLAMRRWPLVVAAFAATVAFTVWLALHIPTAFVPLEDQGYFIVTAQLQSAASLQRTQQVAQDVVETLLDTPGIASVVVVGGLDLLAGTSASNAFACFPVLEPWSQRSSSALSLEGILARVRPRLDAQPDAEIRAFNPPPIRGLGRTGGFQLQVLDESGAPLAALARETRALIEEASRSGSVRGLVTTFHSDVPQYAIEFDRDKAKALGLALSDVFTTLQVYLGGYYVNDFDRFGRVYRVTVQAQGEDRASPDEVGRLEVRSAAGDMVPLSTLVGVRRVTGPQTIPHYNLFRTAAINGEAAPGHSSGQALRAMDAAAARALPEGFGSDWTGLAFQEVRSGGEAPLVFALALTVVFLLLAALYESWSLPFTVMLVVPTAILGALVAQGLRGLDDDVFCQVGLVMLVGLASKNAILIVEFAKVLREQGHSIEEAAIEAARVRLRPILMTSFAFVFGVLPLVLARGAGANARHSLGTAVFGGMLASTFLSLAVVPVSFVLVERLREHILGARGRRAPPVARR